MKCVIVVLLVYLTSCLESKGLKEEFTWTKINYVWPNNVEAKANEYGNELDSKNGTVRIKYIYENNVPMGANRWKNKLFVAVPRRRLGIPSTLNFVWINSTARHNVPLIPYPDWHTNHPDRIREPDAFVSVYRTTVDACDRLWFIDAGEIDTLGNNTAIFPPRIVVIDLNTDQVIRRYTFKPTDIDPHSAFVNLAVDVSADACEKAFAYVPDLFGYGLVVYDFQENDSWRVTHNYFYLEPLYGDLKIGGVKFQWHDGVFSVAVSPTDLDGHRTVYFHALAGVNLYKVSTRILRNKTLATRSYHENDFQVVLHRGKNSQTSTSDLHKTSGVIFFAMINQNAVGCWNTNQKAIRRNFDIVHKDDQKLIYPADLKVSKDEVIVISNKMPVFVYDKLDYDEINFRVWITNVADAVRNTSCS